VSGWASTRSGFLRREHVAREPLRAARQVEVGGRIEGDAVGLREPPEEAAHGREPPELRGHAPGPSALSAVVEEPALVLLDDRPRHFLGPDDPARLAPLGECAQPRGPRGERSFRVLPRSECVEMRLHQRAHRARCHGELSPALPLVRAHALAHQPSSLRLPTTYDCAAPAAPIYAFSGVLSPTSRKWPLPLT
jgi:hypothetical protein